MYTVYVWMVLANPNYVEDTLGYLATNRHNGEACCFIHTYTISSLDHTQLQLPTCHLLLLHALLQFCCCNIPQRHSPTTLAACALTDLLLSQFCCCNDLQRHILHTHSQIHALLLVQLLPCYIHTCNRTHPHLTPTPALTPTLTPALTPFPITRTPTPTPTLKHEHSPNNHSQLCAPKSKPRRRHFGVPQLV